MGKQEQIDEKSNVEQQQLAIAYHIFISSK